MSVIINKPKAKAEETKKRAWTGILKGVPVKFFAKSRGSKPFFVVTEISDDVKNVLEEAPCDVDVADGSALFNASKFCEFAIFDDAQQMLADWGGPQKILCAKANVKLRHSEFDYKAGAGYRAGHANRLEVIGVRFCDEIVPLTGNMEGI